MSQFVAAIDQEATSTRCIIFDHDGNVVVVSQKEHQQIYPQPGREKTYVAWKKAVTRTFDWF